MLGLYLLFVVYGSLIPFRLRDKSLAEAIELFANIRYLSLGVGSRADWIANGLLYLPLAFLAMAWLHRGRGPDRRTWLRGAAVLVACATLAVGIEFVQVFFSPRTVSINDLLAEGIGIGLGLALWRFTGTGLARHWREVLVGGGRGLVAALWLYLAAYLALALFPLDLLVSAREIGAKLAGGGWGLLLAPSACPSTLRCGAKLAAEVVAALPLGALAYFAGMARPSPAGGAALLPRAALLGGLLGAGLELVQLFLASGTSQGLSVATRIAGLWLGMVGARRLLQAVATTAPAAARGAVALRSQAWGAWTASRWGVGVQAAIGLAALPYAVVAFALNGWFRAAWQPLELALGKLRWEMVLPFYYHYFSSETGAMESLLANLVLYLPLGAGLWAWRLAARLRGQAPGRGPAWEAGAGAAQGALLAVGLALVAEAGKLFVPGKHPDPTNLLIAAVAGWAGYAGLAWLRAQLLAWQAGAALAPGPASAGPLRPGGPAFPTAGPQPPAPAARGPAPGPTAVPAAARVPLLERAMVAGRPPASPGTLPAGPLAAPAPDVVSPRPLGRGPWLWARVALAVALLVPVALVLLRFPVAAAWLAVGLVGYAGLLWRRPLAWLLVVPAALPVLDLAVWSGWYFVDELDLLVVVTLAVLLVRAPPRRVDPPLPPAVRGLTVLLALALAVSAVRGFLPAQAPDLNAFAHYYSHWNALRIGKGFLWALLLVPFLRRSLARPGAAERYFVPGVLAGLAGAVALVLWERWSFPGLFNFAAEYRSTAGFSSMHTGGASVDVYLAFALPFVAALFLVWRDPWRYALGLVLFAGALYALLVTFSRIDYLAFLLSAAVLGVGLARARLADRQFFAIALPAAAITALVAVPILLAPYIHVRFATLQADAEDRAAHWGEVLALRDDGLATALFGLGLGSFPRAYFWADPGPRRPGSFRYVAEGGEVFLRLGAGRPVYVLQRIAPGASEPHQLHARIRASGGAAALGVVACEKSLLYSARCVSSQLGPPTGGGWGEASATLRLGDLGRRGRPVYLALYNGRQGTLVDVAQVSLVDGAGREVLANGDFERGFDRWFFTSDDHLSWHVKSLWMYLLVEAGWLGVLLVGLLLLEALRRAALAGWRGQALGTVLAAALVGVLTLAAADSVFDTPRITLLVLLAVYVAVLSGTPPQGQRATGAAPRPGPVVSPPGLAARRSQAPAGS